MLRFLSRRRRLLVLVCALSIAGPAEAQDAISDFFGTIFGGRPSNAQRYHPRVARPPQIRPKVRAAPHPRERRIVKENPARPPEAQGAAGSNVPQPGDPAAQQQAGSFVVAVIGDSEAAILARGLEDAFSADRRVAVLNKAQDDSGLVREDFYDWRKGATALLDGQQRVDMAVMQIGINDNQPLRQDAGRALEPLSKEFNEAYARRVEEIAAFFRDKNVPLVWVGLPIMRNAALSRAAMTFNNIARQNATAAGAHYVDLWDAFSDVNSDYKASGPDVNGAIVRLRSADGVHFSPAGARKAAYFVEPEIKKVLASLQATPPAQPEQPAAVSPDGPVQPATPGGTEPAVAAPQPPPAPTLVGKVLPLNDQALSPGGSLASLPPPANAVRAPGAPSKAGRADDFSWPAKEAPAPQK
jgi:hypothetical protein